jgi:hypothetical protein
MIGGGVLEMRRPIPAQATEQGILLDRETLASLLRLLASLLENKPLSVAERDELLVMAMTRMSLIVCDLLNERLSGRL